MEDKVVVIVECLEPQMMNYDELSTILPLF